MAGGIMVAESGRRDIPAKLTGQVIICSIIAAFGGFMFGYDIGISGGVTSMDDFLIKFFPAVYEKKHRAKENNYCKYDNEYLQLFTSSLYLAATLASWIASFTCRTMGRKPNILMASVFFLIGAILNVFAFNLIMLILGRIFLGFGVGFGNQTVPLFISEIAPPRYRGGLNVMFQLLITIGILIANVINYGTSRVKGYGWRISLGGAAVPALILLFGSLIIVETPVSLIERGKLEEARKALRKIRGVENIELEYQELCQASEMAKNKTNFCSVFKKRNRPPLLVTTLIMILQQFTGINVIMFYAPVLFQTMGLGSDASLLSSVVTGGVNCVATLVAVVLVDRVGRKGLLLEGAIQMIASQLATGIILRKYLHATNEIPPVDAKIVLVLICAFVSGFAWSWGPLAWLITSEIFPLETRNAGYFFGVGANMICTFIIAQVFLSMLCSMKSALFFFFVCWLVVAFFFIIFYLPETKGIPMDEMVDRAWRKHWFWKSNFKEDEQPDKNVKEIETVTTSKPEEEEKEIQ